MEKWQLLQSNMKEKGSLALAVSGGVDSAFLLAAAKEALGEKVIAFTAVSPFFSQAEMQEAEDLCRTLGVPHVKVEIPWEEMQSFTHNPADRCYHCKRLIFGKLKDAALERGFPVLADGTNADDGGDYRPGMKALEELGILSPLKDAGYTKGEIREELKKRGIALWNKPAAACLASRIPYEQEITLDKLNMVAQAEKALRELGFSQVRVRHHGDVARIEVSPEDRVRFFEPDVMNEAERLVKEAGFAYAALDLGGYRTGSLNELLKK
ncbi:MAG: ATP-dependent sacrificial sulfur transferase LarE [Firmicutes bacterium]|nr:ATP-dependent sacrificial sulfur transferase LarE [Bacillota bacterium]